MTIRYGSVCSGIESASVAWEPLGMQAAWFSEFEPGPSAVLAHHWPNVANLGDMNYIPVMLRLGILEAPAVLVGGTPCQAFSVAGAGESLDDPRGQLTLKYVEVLNEIDNRRPGDEAVCVWENVPGVLSTKDNAFGCFLGALAGSGHELQPGEKPPVGKSTGFWAWDKKQKFHRARWPHAGEVHGPQRSIAWRVFDAQYFGLAQRRKRVFLVASARDGFNPGEILFESEGVRRDTPPSRKQGQGTADCVTGGVGNADRDAQTNNLVLPEFFPRLKSDNLADASDLCPTLAARDHKDFGGGLVMVFEPRSADGVPRIGPDQTICPTLNAMGGGQREPCVVARSRVRKLMPVECERLQGFPDGHTDVPYRGKPACDGPRYKSLGNSKAVDCIAWVGSRVKEYLEG